MVYVFRINYDPDCYPKLREQVFEYGFLRQGWGGDNMSIENSYDSFRNAWHKKWGPDDSSDRYIKSKYNNIAIMKEMKKDDIVVIPKMSYNCKDVCQEFMVVKVTEKYSFSPIQSEQDFGHIIPVEIMFSCPYYFNSDSRKICAKFRAYQRAVNCVYSEEFIQSIRNLIDCSASGMSFDRKNMKTAIESLSEPTYNTRLDYIKNIIKTINDWSPKQFENIIEELFVANGYTKIRQNTFDGGGGDVDLVFTTFADNTLMGDIVSSFDEVFTPEIRVQAKKKTGKDEKDYEGVIQLIRMMRNEKNSDINILIHLTEKEFSKDAKELAQENGIILINGPRFVMLLLKYSKFLFN